MSSALLLINNNIYCIIYEPFLRFGDQFTKRGLMFRTYREAR